VAVNDAIDLAAEAACEKGPDRSSPRPAAIAFIVVALVDAARGQHDRGVEVRSSPIIDCTRTGRRLPRPALELGDHRPITLGNRGHCARRARICKRTGGFPVRHHRVRAFGCGPAGAPIVLWPPPLVTGDSAMSRAVDAATTNVTIFPEMTADAGQGRRRKNQGP
jgi:hypothetical protein